MTSPVPPDRNTWRKLISPALRVVDSLKSTGYGELEFRLGGGTVLMFRFDHRVSKDVDIFTHDAQALAWLSPRLNQVAEALTPNYQEQANALKLTLPHGDIDFIVAAPILPNAPCETIMIAGREITLDATSEILAKKLAYRADTFTVRDALDMSVALELDRPSAVLALRATRHRRDALMARLHLMKDAPQADLARSLLLLPAGEPHAKDLASRLIHAILHIDGQAKPKTPTATPRRRDDGMEM